MKHEPGGRLNPPTHLSVPGQIIVPVGPGVYALAYLPIPIHLPAEVVREWDAPSVAEIEALYASGEGDDRPLPILLRGSLS